MKISILPRKSALVALAEFIAPLEPAPRTAILLRGFRERRSIRVFPFWNESAAVFRPAVVAAAPEMLRHLAFSSGPSWEAPRTAAVALCREGQAPFREEDRDLIWEAFGVPVFEQLLSLNGELLAAECEAHAGLHMHRAGVEREGYAVDSAPCGCGAATPRLVALSGAERADAASASLLS